MSQLERPRIHFAGTFETNVGTANNDDTAPPPVVDVANVAVDSRGMTDDEAAVRHAVQGTAGLTMRFCLYLMSPGLSNDELAAKFAAGERVSNPAVGHDRHHRPLAGGRTGIDGEGAAPAAVGDHDRPEGLGSTGPGGRPGWTRTARSSASSW